MPSGIAAILEFVNSKVCRYKPKLDDVGFSGSLLQNKLIDASYDATKEELQVYYDGKLLFEYNDKTCNEELSVRVRDAYNQLKDSFVVVNS